jgi:hypothetical protein
MSDTPRTDQIEKLAYWFQDDMTPVCESRFVRSLERELHAAQERINRLEEFVNRFFDPEDLGYVVSTVVRDDAREAIGMKRAESGSRVSMI